MKTGELTVVVVNQPGDERVQQVLRQLAAFLAKVLAGGIK